TYQTINPKHPGKPGQPINKDPNGPKYPSDTDAQSLTITGTQTIHYVDQNGNPVAPDDTSQHVQFTHEIVIDKVTGQRIADHGWTNAQTYQKVKVPTVKGYTADKTVAGGETVTYKRPDSIAYVHYTPIEQQRAQVIYVDQSTGDYLKTVTKTGAAMTTIPYQSKDDLKGYLDAGYVLIKNGYDPVGKAPSFDNQTATDQIFYITLNHNTKETSRQDVVTETIHYIYADGKKAHDDVTVQKHFTQKGTQDLVTKQISWQPVASQQFTSVASPAIDGYHADQPVIPAVIVNYGSPDIVKTVTYTAGDQQATIIYVDDTTGNELNRISENGKSGKQIPYSSKQDLLSYEEQGYVLVTNGYDVNGIPSFDKDENINQIFYINLKHGTQSVTPNNPGNPKEPNIPGKPQHPTDYDPATLEKDVTRTIKYVVNGNHQVPDSIKQTVHFEQKGLYDKVTGEWITPLSWVVDHQL
ncbi:MAG: mucin-binding protein, partial [Limosilactobacillus pontis]